MASGRLPRRGAALASITALCVGLTVGCTSGPASPAAGGSAAGGAAPGAHATSSAPVAGTLSVPKTLVSSVKAWDSGPGGAALKVVSGQVGVVLQTVGLRQYGAARGACVKLTASVHAARVNAPIPDTAMQHLYQTALTELGRGAANCQASISKGPQHIKTPRDAQLLHQSVSVLSAGADDLYRATGEIDALKRR